MFLISISTYAKKEVEMIYDEKLGKVVYQPVSIKPNISVPKVIRDK